MTERVPDDCPDPTCLADEDDELGWDRSLHGRMTDFAEPDEAVATIPWTGV